MTTQTATLNMPATTPVGVTEKDIIRQLRSYAYERKHAIGMYPHADGAQDKLLAIEEILFELRRAEACPMPRAAIQLVMHQALNYHYIAPRHTRKLFKTWYVKVEAIFSACRNYLGLQRQY